MTPSEFLADQAERNLGLLTMTLADMTDADMMTRPCDDSNHANWQLGHLITSEVMMVSMMPGAPPFPTLPENFTSLYGRGTKSLDDASAYPTKDVLLDLATQVRTASIAWMKGLSPEVLMQEVETPLGPMAPTVAHLAAIIPTHTVMHLGQMQVIRRKTGKPVLF